jgi:hypothetical protein
MEHMLVYGLALVIEQVISMIPKELNEVTVSHMNPDRLSLMQK